MPFYRTLWFRFALCGIVCVTVVGFFTMATRMQLQHGGGNYEDMFLYQACTYVMLWLNFPVFWLWDMIGKLLYGGNTDQMFGLIPLMLVSIAMWWVFLGAILGTFFYIIWQRFFIRHH